VLSDSVIVFRFLPKTLWCQESPNWSKEQVEFPREMLEHENSYLHDVNPVGDRHFAVAIFVHEVLLQKWFNCQIFSPIVYLSTSTFRNWWSWWSQWVFIAAWHCYLSIMVVCLFCLFVTFRSPKPPVPIAAVLVLSQSPWWVGSHQGGFTMFGPMVQESWNIEQFCHWKLNKIWDQLGCALGIAGKPSMSRILWRWF
jgi:hypothetical protein